MLSCYKTESDNICFEMNKISEQKNDCIEKQKSKDINLDE